MNGEGDPELEEVLCLLQAARDRDRVRIKESLRSLRWAMVFSTLVCVALPVGIWFGARWWAVWPGIFVNVVSVGHCAVVHCRLQRALQR